MAARLSCAVAFSVRCASAWRLGASSSSQPRADNTAEFQDDIPESTAQQEGLSPIDRLSAQFAALAVSEQGGARRTEASDGLEPGGNARRPPPVQLSLEDVSDVLTAPCGVCAKACLHMAGPHGAKGVARCTACQGCFHTACIGVVQDLDNVAQKINDHCVKCGADGSLEKIDIDWGWHNKERPTKKQKEDRSESTGGPPPERGEAVLRPNAVEAVLRPNEDGMRLLNLCFAKLAFQQYLLSDTGARSPDVRDLRQHDAEMLLQQENVSCFCDDADEEEVTLAGLTPFLSQARDDYYEWLRAAEHAPEEVTREVDAGVDQQPDAATVLASECAICCDANLRMDGCEGSQGVVYLSKCKHAFHGYCLQRWKRGNEQKECPTCKVTSQPLKFKNFDWGWRPGTLRPDGEGVALLNRCFAKLASQEMDDTRRKNADARIKGSAQVPASCQDHCRVGPDSGPSSDGGEWSQCLDKVRTDYYRWLRKAMEAVQNGAVETVLVAGNEAIRRRNRERHEDRAAASEAKKTRRKIAQEKQREEKERAEKERRAEKNRRSRGKQQAKSKASAKNQAAKKSEPVEAALSKEGWQFSRDFKESKKGDWKFDLKKFVTDMDALRADWMKRRDAAMLVHKEEWSPDKCFEEFLSMLNGSELEEGQWIGQPVVEDSLSSQLTLLQEPAHDKNLKLFNKVYGDVATYVTMLAGMQPKKAYTLEQLKEWTAPDGRPFDRLEVRKRTSSVERNATTFETILDARMWPWVAALRNEFQHEFTQLVQKQRGGT